MSAPIQIRCMQYSDLPLFREWLFLPHVAKWYHEPEDWIAEIEQQDGAFAFVRHFIAESEEKAFGFGQYYPYWLSGEDWHGSIPLEGTYSIDYMIGDPAFLKKGYGRQIILSLLDKIKQVPDASRVIVQPEPENAASCGVLRACGFVFDEPNGVFLLAL
ncbi:MAG TPA: GNAT family N-acetyltransferase [Clostridia bacterium]|nr:GNAT family N-acetyltransferase [Clostridia bacterium]